MTTRLAAIPEADLNAEQKRVAAALIAGPRGAVRGPFLALLRRPELADRIRLVGDYIRSNDAIGFDVREVAILTVARFWEASYEWGSHVKVALEGGMDKRLVDGIRDGDLPPETPSHLRAVHEFCVQTLERHDVSDDVYKALLIDLGEEGIVDLVGIVSYFSMACMIFNLTRMAPADPQMQLRTV